MITVSNLTFSYGEQNVLEDVSFRADAGELLCVLGPNGVGKSTLFRCILGLESKYRGTIVCAGEDTRKIPADKLARMIAYVPQSHSPSFNYSVFDMVLMGTTAHVGGFASPGKAQTELAEKALETVGIAHLAYRGYQRISGGERQLTLVARSLAQQARLIIMDEPTANLDYGNGLRVLKQVKDLAASGLAVIQSTHNPDHAFLFADRVLALKDGAVAAEGKPVGTVTEELIESLYGIKSRVREFDGQHRVYPLL
jgi:iron complex transport system ATP-binding protein